jgi:hypothetical protein
MASKAGELDPPEVLALSSHCHQGQKETSWFFFTEQEHPMTSQVALLVGIQKDQFCLHEVHRVFSFMEGK